MRLPLASSASPPSASNRAATAGCSAISSLKRLISEGAPPPAVRRRTPVVLGDGCIGRPPHLARLTQALADSAANRPPAPPVHQSTGFDGRYPQGHATQTRRAGSRRAPRR